MIQPTQDGAPEENTWGLNPLNLHLNVNVHVQKTEEKMVLFLYNNYLGPWKPS